MFIVKYIDFSSPRLQVSSIITNPIGFIKSTLLFLLSNSIKHYHLDNYFYYDLRLKVNIDM